VQSYNPLDALVVVVGGVLTDRLDRGPEGFDPALVRLFERLSASVRVVALIDAPVELPVARDAIEHALGAFEAVLVLGDHGLALPDEAAFDTVLDLLEIPPGEIGWIDAGAASLHAAAAIGFRTFEAGDAATLADELEPHLNTIPGNPEPG